MEASESLVAILFMTHFIDDIIIAEYRKLRKEAPAGHDVILLYNTTERLPREPPPDIVVFRFNEKDIQNLRYPVKKCRIESYNIELFVINFWLKNSGYSYYWVIENDVRFSGDWSLPLEAFRDSAVDLLSTTIYRYASNPDWANWPSLRPPPGVLLSDRERISSFLPFYRISAAALTVLHQAYRQGWGGHCECTVPTILHHAGLTIEDIGGDGEFVRPCNRNRFYRNTPKTRTHGPGTLVFRPVLQNMGEEPGMLWHPVKSGSAMVTNRRARFLRRMRILLRNIRHWGQVASS